MNPLSAVSWLWRAWRGKSITFATLFALSILGFSILSEFRHLLWRVGAPWYVWLIVPFFVVARLSWRETQWVPDPVERKKWALRIVFGSIAAAILIAKLKPSPREPAPPAAVPAQNSGRADPHGR